MSNRFQMTKFQKEVTEELEAKLAGLDGAEREERYSDTKTLVDDAFESDRISNFPLVGYTEQDSLKYILDNREEIMDVVQESAKEGTDIPMSDMLTNPNGFLISVYMEESKKLLSYSSLNEKSSFTVREALNVTANLETDVNMKRQMETDATDSRYGKTMNFLKEYDFTPLYGRSFHNVNEMVEEIPQLPAGNKEDAKDILQNLHFGRLSGFKMNDFIAEDIHMTLSDPKLVMRDYAAMAESGEKEFQDKIYGIYQREQASLPSALQDMNKMTFISHIYNKDQYESFTKSGKVRSIRGNRFLKDILPVMTYRQYEVYRGIPLNDNVKLVRSEHGAEHRFETGKMIREFSLYRGNDKGDVETALNRAVALFRSSEVKDASGKVADYLDMCVENFGKSDGADFLKHISETCLSKQNIRMRPSNTRPVEKMNSNDLMNNHL